MVNIVLRYYKRNFKILISKFAIRNPQKIHKIYQIIATTCILRMKNVSKDKLLQKWPSMPDRIYNSHYDNGVPAMFKS